MAENIYASFSGIPKAPVISRVPPVPQPPHLKQSKSSHLQNVMLPGASGNEATKIQELKLTLNRISSLMSSGVTPEKIEEYKVLSVHADSLVNSLPEDTAKNVLNTYPTEVKKALDYGSGRSNFTDNNNTQTSVATRDAIQVKQQEIIRQQQEADFNRQFKEGNFAALEGKSPAQWNSFLRNDSINDMKGLTYAIQNGWDINAQHKNVDGTVSTYVEKQQSNFSKTARNCQMTEEQSDKAFQLMQEAASKGNKEKEEKLRKYQEKLEELQQKERKKQLQAIENTTNAVKTGKLNAPETLKATQVYEEAQKEAQRLEKRAQALDVQGRSHEAIQTRTHAQTLRKAVNTGRGILKKQKAAEEANKYEKKINLHQVRNSLSTQSLQEQESTVLRQPLPKAPLFGNVDQFEKRNVADTNLNNNEIHPQISLATSQANAPILPRNVENKNITEQQKESGDNKSVSSPRIPNSFNAQSMAKTTETTSLNTMKRREGITVNSDQTSENESETPPAPRRPNLLACLGNNSSKVADQSQNETIAYAAIPVGRAV